MISVNAGDFADGASQHLIVQREGDLCREFQRMRHILCHEHQVGVGVLSFEAAERQRNGAGAALDREHQIAKLRAQLIEVSSRRRLHPDLDDGHLARREQLHAAAHDLAHIPTERDTHVELERVVRAALERPRAVPAHDAVLLLDVAQDLRVQMLGHPTHEREISRMQPREPFGRDDPAEVELLALCLTDKLNGIPAVRDFARLVDIDVSHGPVRSDVALDDGLVTNPLVSVEELDDIPHVLREELPQARGLVGLLDGDATAAGRDTHEGVPRDDLQPPSDTVAWSEDDVAGEYVGTRAVCRKHSLREFPHIPLVITAVSPVTGE